MSARLIDVFDRGLIGLLLGLAYSAAFYKVMALF